MPILPRSLLQLYRHSSSFHKAPLAQASFPPAEYLNETKTKKFMPKTPRKRLLRKACLARRVGHALLFSLSLTGACLWLQARCNLFFSGFTPRKQQRGALFHAPQATFSSCYSPLAPDGPEMRHILYNLYYLAQQIGPRPAGSLAEKRAALWLAQQLRQAGYEVHFQGPIPLRQLKRQTQNVVGIKRNPYTKQRVLVGAHYDSYARPGCMGANDNASGVAVILALAPLLASHQLPYTLEIVFFGAEEACGASSLVGSSYFVQQALRAGELPAAMICVDMVGRGSHLYLWHAGPSSNKLATLFRRQAEALGLSPLCRHSSHGSDYVPFARAGIPAIWLQRLPDEANHSAGDGLGRIQAAALQETASLLWRTLLSREWSVFN